MTDANSTALLEQARSAALEAGRAIMEIYHSGEFGTTEKADASPLTLADRTAHHIIMQHLTKTGLPILSEEGQHTPYQERCKWDWYWLVDPLDGTKEFLKRNGEFTVNIALMQQQKPVGGVVYAPTLETLFYGSKETGVYKEEKGNRIRLDPQQPSATIENLLQQPLVRVIASRSHLNAETISYTRQFKNVEFVSMGSSLKFMLLAENKAHIYPRFAPTMEWDTAAAHAILLALDKDIYQANLETTLTYNKPNLLNPSFISY